MAPLGLGLIRTKVLCGVLDSLLKGLPAISPSERSEYTAKDTAREDAQEKKRMLLLCFILFRWLRIPGTGLY